MDFIDFFYKNIWRPDIELNMYIQCEMIKEKNENEFLWVVPNIYKALTVYYALF